MAYLLGKFYCPLRRELFECQTCGNVRPMDRFLISKNIRGKVMTRKCKDCQNRVLCPNPKPREEINKSMSIAALKVWDKRGRPSDRLNGYDYREKLPKKKELPASYPVWE